jgi:hypothetical protein
VPSPARPPRRPAAPLAAGLAAALCCCAAAGQARASPLPPGTPVFTLELEGQYAQPGAARTRGGGGALGAAVRLSDQLFVTGTVTQLATGAGPVTTVGFGLRAIFDSTPLAPFAELQVVDLAPEATAGYQLATRIGGGADWHLTPAVAIGFAIRTLTPVDAGAPVTLAGVEVGLRLTFTPGFWR